MVSYLLFVSPRLVSGLYASKSPPGVPGGEAQPLGEEGYRSARNERERGNGRVGIRR